jgi:glycosyltransferase involved in cell wall biosynthesis
VRLLYCITRAEVGGAQNHLIALVRHFHLSHEVMVVVGESGWVQDECERMNVECIVATNLQRAPSPRRDWRAVRELRAIIERFRPDVVHAHSSKAGTIGRIAARLEHVPCVFTAHGLAFGKGKPPSIAIVGLVTEWVMSFFTAQLIVVSRYDHDLARRVRLHRHCPITMIHNGLASLAATAPAAATRAPIGRRDSAPGALRIVMIARLNAPKDPAPLIRAIHRAKDASIELVIIGDGPARPTYEALVTDLAMGERVAFLGERNDVDAVLSTCDVGALISHYEGLPITVLEMMRAGLAIIASDVGGISEMVVDGVTGVLVTWSDEYSIDRAFVHLGDPEVRQRYGRAGRQRFEEHFGESTMLDQVSDVYRQVVDASVVA